MENSYEEDFTWAGHSDEFIRGYVLGKDNFIVWIKGWAHEWCPYNGHMYIEEEE